ncbi:MAG: fimbrillin family protein, partial [Bacteroidaceae bacterium]|nr:fimbrillin family protein [Bacteroidaceae bacterium]
MIRKITYRQLYILVATLLAVTSCTGDDTLTDTKMPMTFTCNAIAQTRAEGEYVAYDGPAFGVAAIHHGRSNRPTADVTTYIDNAQVSKQGSVWATNPIYYWPHQGDMHFAAYSPYIADFANSNVSITLPQNGEGYTYSGTIDGQTNLMFADEQYGSYDGFQNGTVPVVFNHALTQVRFCAKMSTASAGTTFNIKSLQLVNVRSRGTVNFTHD